MININNSVYNISFYILANILFMCFNLSMNINRIQLNTNFRNSSTLQQDKKPELIDKLMGVVQNQRDVNDCIAVPRGIFKAYLWIMTGFGLIGIATALPQKLAKTKSALSIVGNICNIMSAFYFAKPFAFKGVSPTVDMNEMNK